MTKAQILGKLRQHGFREGRMISYSKSMYCQRHPGHFVVFNSKVFTRRALILRQADLDLTVDAEKLIAAAHAVGENFYVLAESHPNPFWEPGSVPMQQVLCSATWWTRIRPEDQDVFFPVDAARRHSKRLPLRCVTGLWQGRPAYSVTCWENAAIDNQNMNGAALEIAGQPPKEIRFKKVERDVDLSKPPSSTRGRPVHPVFYQQSGLLEYVWFDCGFAMPAALYDQAVRPLGQAAFTLHREHEAIHIRQHGQVIGLIWPCFIGAQEVAANARRRLGLKTVKGSCSDEPR